PRWLCLICIYGETACRRAAIRRVCCWTPPREKARRLPPNDCGSCKLSVVGKCGRQESSLPPRKVTPPQSTRRLPGYSGRKLRLMPARLIPQGKFHPVPESKLVVDYAQIILHHVFR